MTTMTTIVKLRVKHWQVTHIHNGQEKVVDGFTDYDAVLSVVRELMRDGIRDIWISSYYVSE